MTTYHLVDSTTLKKWLDNDEAVLIDVRESQEHQSTNIPGAHNIPLGVIEKNLIPDFANKKLVLHCGIGKRSSMACEKLLSEDKNLVLYSLEGGISAWKNAGLPLKHGTRTKKSLSLDRQLQISLGTLILLSLLLAFFFHPLFLLITAFVGIILLWAGITGASRLVMGMSAMPWNRKKK